MRGQDDVGISENVPNVEQMVKYLKQMVCLNSGPPPLLTRLDMYEFHPPSLKRGGRYEQLYKLLISDECLRNAHA